MEKYYTYLIENKTNGKKYIGSHKTESDDMINDGYWGSSKSLRSDIKKLGIENFKKTVFKVYPDYKSMFDDEAKLILEHNTLYPDGYNMVIMKRYHTKRVMSEKEKEKRKLNRLRKKANVLDIPEYDQLMNELDYNKYLNELINKSNDKIKLLKEIVKNTKVTIDKDKTFKEKDLKLLYKKIGMDAIIERIRDKRINPKLKKSLKEYNEKEKEQVKGLKRAIAMMRKEPFGKEPTNGYYWMDSKWEEPEWIPALISNAIKKGFV